MYGFVSPECQGVGNHPNSLLCDACSARYDQFVRRCKNQSENRRHSDHPSKIDKRSIDGQCSPTDLKKANRTRSETIQQLRVKLRSADKMVQALSNNNEEETSGKRSKYVHPPRTAQAQEVEEAADRWAAGKLGLK
jgi:hypothetical protein